MIGLGVCTCGVGAWVDDRVRFRGMYVCEWVGGWIIGVGCVCECEWVGGWMIGLGLGVCSNLDWLCPWNHHKCILCLYLFSLSVGMMYECSVDNII